MTVGIVLKTRGLLNKYPYENPFLNMGGGGGGGGGLGRGVGWV